jgi:hypothetical protein
VDPDHALHHLPAGYGTRSTVLEAAVMCSVAHKPRLPKVLDAPYPAISVAAVSSVPVAARGTGSRSSETSRPSCPARHNRGRNKPRSEGPAAKWSAEG